MQTALPKNSVNIKGMAPLLQVFDMPASLKFYRDILGFSIIQSSGEGDDVDWVLLKLNGVELMLNTLYEKQSRPSVPDISRNNIHKDIIIYFGCPDVEDTYDYFTRQHVAVSKPAITGYGWKAINMLDPDGYCLCFHWPIQ